MTKQNTTLAGAVAVIVILVATVMLGILPQLREASTSRSAESDLTQTNDLLGVQLASLAQQSKDLEGLDAELDQLRAQVPATADLASVTRVIVTALTANDGSRYATLVSIRPQVPPVAFTPREQLLPDVAEPDVPQPTAAATDEPLPAGTFQEVPLVITATAPDVFSAFRFVDGLNAGPRLLAVHHVQVAQESTGEDQVTVMVTGAAYLQPDVRSGTKG